MIISTRNAVKELDFSDKAKVQELFEPVLSNLLETASYGLKRETQELLREFGVYDVSYDQLEAIYVREIKKGKSPIFYRNLILQNHHSKVPKLRAILMGLHQESDDSIRSIIQSEFPHLR